MATVTRARAIAMRCLVGCWIPYALIPLQFLLASGPDALSFALACAAYGIFLLGVLVVLFKVRDRRARLIGLLLHGLYAAIQGVLWWRVLSAPD